MKKNLDSYMTELMKEFVNGEFSLPLDDKNEIIIIPQKVEETKNEM